MSDFSKGKFSSNSYVDRENIFVELFLCASLKYIDNMGNSFEILAPTIMILSRDGMSISLISNDGMVG